MATKKKKVGSALVPAGAKGKAAKKGYEKHPLEMHPAVGLLTHAFQDQNAEADPDSTDAAGVCGRCGFDEGFHELDVDDYKGPPREGEWANREAALRAGKKFSDKRECPADVDDLEDFDEDEADA